ncbi:MAG TPA: LLM class F420-dependent oxidoreductase [Candidatus Binataceae bacterium]
MKFGTFLIQSVGTLPMRSDPDEMVAFARSVEELGFESLWVGDHILVPRNPASTYPYDQSGRLPENVFFLDPITTLSFVACATTRIRLGVGVFVLPLRNPFATAKAVATLDLLSKGRFIFGVGIGWLAEEFRAVGMNFSDRAARNAEYLALMDELWNSESPIFKGPTVEANGFVFLPKPTQKPHPPLVFGGNTHAALKRAVRYGDGWYGLPRSLDDARAMVQRLRGLENAVGRMRPLEITLSGGFSRGGKVSTPAATLDEARCLEELGVERIIVSAHGAALPDALKMLRHYNDEVITRI